jgi:hypothetical protein
LKCAIAERVRASELLLARSGENIGELGALREQARNVLVKPQVIRNDRANRRGHGFFNIAGHQRRFEPFFRFRRLDENDPHGHRVGGRWSQLGEIIDPPQKIVVHRFGQPGGVGTGLAKNHVERFVVQRLAHVVTPGKSIGFGAWHWEYNQKRGICHGIPARFGLTDPNGFGVEPGSPSAATSRKHGRHL